MKPMGGRTWKYWPASGPVLATYEKSAFPKKSEWEPESSEETLIFKSRKQMAGKRKRKGRKVEPAKGKGGGGVAPKRERTRIEEVA